MSPLPTRGIMRARIVLLAIVGALGACAPRAAICVPGAKGCAEVREQLEVARANIGAKCGTPTMGAAIKLALMGPEVATYLMRALSDRDYDVAMVAAMALVDMGEGERLAGWCMRHPDHEHAQKLCKGVDEQIAGVAGIAIDGVWTGEAAVCGEPCDWTRVTPAPARLTVRTIDGVAKGELCVDGVCRRITGSVDGRRFAMSDGVDEARIWITFPRITGALGALHLVLDTDGRR